MCALDFVASQLVDGSASPHSDDRARDDLRGGLGFGVCCVLKLRTDLSASLNSIPCGEGKGGASTERRPPVSF